MFACPPQSRLDPSCLASGGGVSAWARMISGSFFLPSLLVFVVSSSMPPLCKGIFENGVRVTPCIYAGDVPGHPKRLDLNMGGSCFFCCSEQDKISELFNNKKALGNVMRTWKKLDDDRHHSAIERLTEVHRLHFAERRDCIGREGIAPCCWISHHGCNAGKPAKVAWPEKLCDFCDSTKLQARCVADLASVAIDLKKMKVNFRKKHCRNFWHCVDMQHNLHR